MPLFNRRKLRRRGSEFFSKLPFQFRRRGTSRANSCNGSQASSENSSLDSTPSAASVPAHRTMASPPPILNLSKMRSFFGSNSQEPAGSRPASVRNDSSPQDLKPSAHDPGRTVSEPSPKRRRSVRFRGIDHSQLDGTPDDGRESQSRSKSSDSRLSRLSQNLSEKFDQVGTALGMVNGNDTLIHRPKSRPKVPFIDTDANRIADSRSVEDANASPSPTMSSVPSSPTRRTDASPISVASTAASSLISPRSTGSYKRVTPEDYQSKHSKEDDNTLPPIEEDSGYYLFIPVQEAPINIVPTVDTVEKASAAKVYLETSYNELMMEAQSPRSVRRRRFEQKLLDYGVPHAQRVAARQQWARAESDHLRQMRTLNASSFSRHNVKGVSIAGYDVVRVLGKGSFGVVRLVTERAGEKDAVETPKSSSQDDDKTSRSRRTSATPSRMSSSKSDRLKNKPLSEVFAMKVIRKSEMLRNAQEGHLRAERDFLVAATTACSRWIVPLIASFQDNINLYLVMEYMIGGDFLGLLLREDVLEESVAK
ncbi:hypothetical protein MBLNU230_g8433t1 [Neophaeotheca triangularis]